jgi:iron(III) transport system permease protein
MLLAVSFGSMPGSVGEESRGVFGGWIRALVQPEFGAAVLSTVTLAGTYVAISMPIAVGVAWLLARTDVPGADWFEFGFWLSFFLPPLAVVQGYILLFDPASGIANTFWQSVFGGQGLFNIYSWWGIVFAHLVTTSISAKVMLLTPAFRNLDSSLEEAALVAGDSLHKTLMRVVVPVLAPALIVTLLLSIARSLESFEIELVLGTPQRIDVYSTLIYRLIRASVPDYQSASVLGLGIVAVMTILAALQGRITRGRSYVTISGKRQETRFKLGRARWPLAMLIFAMLTVLVIIPLVSLVTGTCMRMYGYFHIADAWTTEHWGSVLGDPVFVDSLLTTLKLSSSVALVSMLAGFLIAYVLVHKTGTAVSRMIDSVSWIPFSMPGILLSFAVLSIVLQTPGLDGLYGSLFLLILALSLGSLTLAIQLNRSGMLQVGPDLEEASLLAGASRLESICRITFRLLIRTIVVTGMIAFVGASVNISRIGLLYTSDTRPLSVMQLEYLLEGRYEAASVIGVIVVAMAIVVALVARLLGHKVRGKHG